MLDSHILAVNNQSAGFTYIAQVAEVFSAVKKKRKEFI